MDILIVVLLILIIGLILFNSLRGDKSNEESEDFLKGIDNSIEIPQFGTKHSLNISVSVGILLWDFYSKMKN